MCDLQDDLSEMFAKYHIRLIPIVDAQDNAEVVEVRVWVVTRHGTAVQSPRESPAPAPVSAAAASGRS
jgi:hypothetical protein